MQRITITLDDDLSAAFEALRARRGYANRSEMVRDMIRERLKAERQTLEPNAPCLASLSYVYNHHVRDLAARLTHAQHQHHQIAVSSMHVHLDHDNCLETAVLRGPAADVQKFADAIIAQPGVRHGHLQLLPTDVAAAEPMETEEAGGEQLSESS